MFANFGERQWRLKDLADRMARDGRLLKEYEDKLRLEDDPKRKILYRQEIEELRESIRRHQKEYNDLESGDRDAPKRLQNFVENLGYSVTLEMVAIPEGHFLMGSPEGKVGRDDSESPQHRVGISPFYMGKYPVTQLQWWAVATLPKVERDLKPDPSYLKGDNLPVERVSWYDAVEFCQRLSQKTGREYRLPSEAEWEYACRAGTRTPFHFGETITTDLANYGGDYGTTPVGSFPANDFGLHDMHGNVWEWCADHWHENYEGAPTDGSIWLSSDEYSSRRVLRGGSWVNPPRGCRSAIRNHSRPVNRVVLNGFRVCCVPPRT